MAEKLSQLLGTEARKLKIGNSFEKKSPGIYHAIRYDFKPVSIDEEKDGVLEVKENNSVAVSLPHINGSGQTNYKGPMKPASNKECILIYDHETGEVTIERITNQILVKKTRAEKASDRKDDDRFLMKQDVEKSNPYEVKKIPDKPSLHNNRERDFLSNHRTRKPSHTKEKETDSDFCITPMNSAKSSPARPGSAKPSPNRPHQVDLLGRPIDQDSSDDSSTSDSDSDFGDEKKPVATVPSGMSSILSQDFTSTVPFPQRGGGVLPTARPESHKTKKSSGHDSSKSKSKMSLPNSKMEASHNSMSNLLGDDLRLSDSDNSD